MVRDRASSYVLGLLGIVPDSFPTDRSAGQLPGFQIVIVNGNAAPALRRTSSTTTARWPNSWHPSSSRSVVSSSNLEASQ